MPVWGGWSVIDARNLKSTIAAKAVPADTQETAPKFFPSHRSYIHLVIAIALCVFLSEVIIMIVIHPWLHLSPWPVALIHALILIVFLSPALYLFVFRPMVQSIR